MLSLFKKENYKTVLIFLFAIFVAVHIFLFNINASEWGDSFRILRASEFLKGGTYPSDEKRLPLYSLLLATNPSGVDAVIWGRGVMFGVSILYFAVFLIYFSKNSEKMTQKSLLLAGLLFLFNPVLLYWSIRLMADAFFGLLALTSLLLVLQFKQNRCYFLLLVSGLLTGLAIWTRFEGYILFASIVAGLFFLDVNEFKDFFNFGQYKRRISSYLKPLFFFLLGSLHLIVWQFFYKNPFGSSYFGEPSGRAYDLTTLFIYATSLLFLFGFTSAFYFLFSNPKKLEKLALKNVSAFFFLIVELILVLVWPAAVPRLFVPVIPLLLILMVPQIMDYFESPGGIFTKINDFVKNLLFQPSRFLIILLFTNSVFVVLYVLTQFFMRLQFLVVSGELVLVIAILNTLSLIFVVLKKYDWFLIATIASVIIWSFAVIWVHKDIFYVTSTGAKYLAQNTTGLVAHNDASAVTPWYLRGRVKYADLTQDQTGSLEYLLENEIKYVLVTNEHNPDLSYDLKKRPFLEDVKIFKKVVNGTEFFTIIGKVKECGCQS